MYHVRQRPGGVGDAARLRLRSARPAGAAASELFLADAIEQARALRRLFGGARPLDAVDLDLPERAAAGTLDLAGLEARVTEGRDRAERAARRGGGRAEQGHGHDRRRAASADPAMRRLRLRGGDSGQRQRRR